MVIAPDGAPAAFCIIWYDALNRFGLFEPVGTHQNFRRRGLAKAVLLHGQRLLQEMGAETAHVYAAGGREGGAALYPAAGFTVVDHSEQWKKQFELLTPSSG
jgi:ribosomal protein S18 acetylase RimI-like enzyme